MLLARKRLLQVSAGLLDHFEIRNPRPPDTLLKLVDSGVPVARREDIVVGILSQPEHCLRLMALRFQVAFPSADALVAGELPLLKTWSETRFVAIDTSESLYSQQRLDLRTIGKARHFDLSVDRIICQQVRAEQRARSGADSAKAALPIQPADDDAS